MKRAATSWRRPWTNTKKPCNTVTLKDIAREAGVSVALVSFVMNNRTGADGKPKYRVGEATRERILEVARRLGYEPAGPARTLGRSPARTVVVVLPSVQPGICGMIERFLYPRGVTVLFGFTGSDPEKISRYQESGLPVWEILEENGDVMEQIRKFFLSL